MFQRMGEQIPVIEKLKGHVLDGRFKISKSMTEGAFGKIFTGIDVLLSDEQAEPPRKFPIVVKFT